MAIVIIFHQKLLYYFNYLLQILLFIYINFKIIFFFN